MSDLADRLEEKARKVIDMRGVARAEGRELSDKEKKINDRLIVDIVSLLSSRITHLTTRYGLDGCAEDARQTGAIAVLHALESYDPALSRFTTHVTWQIRGALKNLSLKMVPQSHKTMKYGAVRLVSLDAHDAIDTHDGVPIPELEIEDCDAQAKTESLASNAMTVSLFDHLLSNDTRSKQDRAPTPERRYDLQKRYEKDRKLAMTHLFDVRPIYANAMSHEQRRQILRRVWRNCRKQMDGAPAIDMRVA